MMSYKKLKYVLSVCLLFVFVLACQGTSAIPNPFATATPTATITPTATPTPSPTPTATFTATPLPTGVNAESKPDGVTFIIDYDNKYQLSIPAGWVVVPLTGKDFAKALSELSEDNPDLKDMAAAFQNLDSDMLRLAALHKDSKYVVDGFATNLTIAVLDDKVMGSMPIAFVTGALEESMKRQGAKVDSNSQETVTNANGVEVGAIDFQQIAPTSTGKKVSVYSHLMVFQSDGKMVMIALATPKQFAGDAPKLLEGVVDSIKPYVP
jgi:hypothetical protein